MASIVNSSSNCKLVYGESIGYLCTEGRKAELDKLLSGYKITTFVHVIRKKEADFILKNYKTYYCEKVPIGYGEKGDTMYQYHILIANPNQIGKSPYLRQLNNQVVKEENLKGEVTKEKVRDELVRILKKKRRKADYIDELINKL